MESGSRTTDEDSALLRTVCACMLLLVFSTWRLWTGQGVFPQVPLLEFAVGWPRWVDHLSLAALLAALVAALVVADVPRLRRSALIAALASLSILWITDQHRLQPWAYHFALSAWAFAFLPAPSSRKWLRALAVSVYVFSALSKFDARFLQTNGALMVATALEWMPVDVQRLPRARLSALAIALPAGELATGLLLALPACRRFGRWCAVGLHLGLIMLLGPWGMNHRWAVLIWNFGFLAQVWLLFARPRATSPRSARLGWSAATVRPARAMTALPLLAAIVLPSLEPFGLWDAWLSWGLYSTRAAKLDVYLPSEVVPRLPSAIRDYADSSPTGAGRIWTRLAIDRWSLDTLQAPIYPHPRFQLGVALAVMRLLPDDARPLLIVASSAPDRRSGSVRKERWSGEEGLRVQAARYHFNARPRDPVAGPSRARAAARHP